jgi:TRAP-type C4-dicarboxylate transport system permease small subunit
MIKLLIRLNGYLAAVEKVLVTVLTGLIALILMCQVVLRYVFSRPLFWAEEACVELMVFMSLIGFSLLLDKKQMISIEFIAERFPQKIRQGLSLILQVISLVTIAYFAVEGTKWIMRPEVRMELSPTAQTPVWINYSVLPLSFYAMGFHQIVGLITSLKPANKG